MTCDIFCCSLLSNWNFDQSGPLWVFGKATLLGLSARGATGACYNAYPTCPRDQNQLVNYLNNHRGGLFRFFSEPYQHHYQSRIQTPANYEGIRAEEGDDNRLELRIQNRPHYQPTYRPSYQSTYQPPYRPTSQHLQQPTYQRPNSQKFLIESAESYQYHTRIQDSNKPHNNYYATNHQSPQQTNDYYQKYTNNNNNNNNNNYYSSSSPSQGFKGFSFPTYDTTNNYKTSHNQPPAYSGHSLHGSGGNKGVRFPSDDPRQIPTPYSGHDYSPGLVLSEDDTKSFRVQQTIRVQKALASDSSGHNLKFPETIINHESSSNQIFPKTK